MKFKSEIFKNLDVSEADMDKSVYTLTLGDVMQFLDDYFKNNPETQEDFKHEVTFGDPEDFDEGAVSNFISETLSDNMDYGEVITGAF